MSLIADALKRAQEQRATDRRDDRARRLLTTAVPVRTAQRPGRLDRGRAAAGAALGAAILVFATVVVAAAGPRASDDDFASAGAVAAADPGPSAEPGLSAAPDMGDVGDREAADAVDGAAAPERPGVEPAARRPPDTPTSPTSPTSPASRAQAPQPAEPEVAAAPAERGEPASFRMSVELGADARELFGRALAAQQAGDAAGAAELYRRAISLRPGDPQLHNNLGTVYRGQGRVEEALASFRAAVEADGRYAPAWSNLGMVLDGLGRSQEALEAFQAALRADPSNTGAKVNLANKYLELGVLEEARRLLAEVLRTDPSLPEAHYAMARALESAGDRVGAIRHYRLFLTLARGRFPALEARVAAHVAALEAR